MRTSPQPSSPMTSALPLVEARNQLNWWHTQLRDEALTRLVGGASLGQILSEPFPEDPLTDDVQSLLEEQRQGSSTPWNDWFNVKTTLLTGAEQVYGPLAFSAFDGLTTERTAIADSAYQVYGQLITEAFSRYWHPHTTEYEGTRLVGVLSELLAPALLNMTGFGYSAAMTASGSDDRLRKTDVDYYYFKDSTPAPEPTLAALQIKTGRATPSPDDTVIYVSMNEVFGGHRRRMHVIELVEQDIAGNISVSSSDELFEAALLLKTVVHQSIDKRSTPTT